MEATPTPYRLLGMLHIQGANGLPRLLFNRQLADLWRVELYQLMEALDWLFAEELVQKGGPCFYITMKGRELYAEICQDPTLHQMHYHKWITEALSGMDARGDRSAINRAAIPSGKGGPKRQQQEAGALGMMAKELDMSVGELTEKLVNKELKLCGGCGKFKPLDRYHKDKSRTDGLHAYCKQCRKTKQNE